jgi:hypothetical protein
MDGRVLVGLNAAIMAVTGNQPRVLTVQREPLDRGGSGGGEEWVDGEPGAPGGEDRAHGEPSTPGSQDRAGGGEDRAGEDPRTRAAASGPGAGRVTFRPARLDAVPFGALELHGDATMELGLRRVVAEQAGVSLGYVEQLYTFGDRFRDPRELARGPRVVSIAYLALVRETRLAEAPEDARWRDCYRFLPWEDWRAGTPRVVAERVAPALQAWVERAQDARGRRHRRERGDIAFGLGGAAWDSERVLERYELLYEVGLVEEAHRDARLRAALEADDADGWAAAAEPGWEENPPTSQPDDVLGVAMALDHRRMVATALGRMRGKIKYRPVVFELLPRSFTLLQLQRVVEALAGIQLHKGNFRRLVDHGGLVEGTGKVQRTKGRPAELFRFRREVLRERRAPGVGTLRSGRR